jgi:beta-glucanase (GH16 family)
MTVSVCYSSMKTNSVSWLPLLLLLAATGCASNHYKMVWHDEFKKNGRPDPQNWNYERGFVRNNELQWYQTENAFCTNGLLVIEARREHRPNPQYAAGSRRWQASREWIDYTSASLTTRGLRQFTYGRFELRARIDTRPGSWPAFWTLGATPGVGWPAGGEVDIMEYYTNVVLANVAYSVNGRAVWSSPRKSIAELGGEAWTKKFHIWTMDWDTNKIDLLLDGKVMNHFDLAKADKSDRGNPFHGPVYFILNQAIGGNQGGDPSSTKFPLRYEIDWVRVYQQVK